MTPERWHQVEEIYQAAMDREPERRAAWIQQACEADDELQREVASLMALNGTATLVDQPAWQAAGDLLDDDPVVAAGAQFGPYRIEGVLDTGGMARVYLARDTRLNRPVAIKIAREEFSARFDREARAVASLNHPNICTMHDVGPNYLVMELVEGPTLASLIEEGPISLTEALRIAQEVGRALEAAHDKGIVHRDLKPANIKIKPDGSVKVLDFGLAKVRPDSHVATAGASELPTITEASLSGAIMGTAPYMSPEQARGMEVDKRTDIWAFGVVLWEMLTGRRLFEGATISDTLVAVLTKEPDLGSVPPKVRRLLGRCLEREAKRRLRDIGDAWDLVEEPAPVAKSTDRWRWVAATAMVGAAALVAGWGWWHASRPSEKQLVRLDVDLGPNVSLGSRGGGSNVILSPDGSRLGFVSDGRLFMRKLEETKVTALAGTEESSSPFFSPDGRWIGFFAQGKLKKISVDGGAPSVVASLRSGANYNSNGAWGEDGYIVAALHNFGHLSRIPTARGEPAAVTESTNEARRWPQLLAGGEAVLFTSNPAVLSGWDEASIEVSWWRDRRTKTVLQGGTFGRYLPTGHLIYVSRGTLFAVPFNLKRMEIRGTPTPVLERVAYSQQDGSAQLDFSHDGRLIYRTASGGNGLSIHLMDQTGRTTPLLAKPAEYLFPSLSPDGRRVAVSIPDGSNRDIWVYDLDRAIPTRLTAGGGTRIWTAWSHDGKTVFYTESKNGIFWSRADGSGRPQFLVSNGTASCNGLTMSANGHLAWYQGAADHFSLWTVSVERDGAGFRAGRPEAFAASQFSQAAPHFSRDGRWLAYESEKSGRNEVYVRHFPDTGMEWQVSKNGGRQPKWSPTTRDLFFGTDYRQVMVAPYIVRGDTFHPSEPHEWSAARYTDLTGPGGKFDLAPDGKHIVVSRRASATEEEVSRTHVIFLENFFDYLRRRVPTEN